MQLYSGSSEQFIEDAVQNRVAGLLAAAFTEQHRHSPSDSEVRSWHNSLSRLKDVFTRADLTDHGVVLEYQQGQLQWPAPARGDHQRCAGLRVLHRRPAGHQALKK